MITSRFMSMNSYNIPCLARRDQAPIETDSVSDQSRPPIRATHACAVGRDSGVRLHLAIELRNQHEGQSRTECRRASGAGPDPMQAVELIPHRLGSCTHSSDMFGPRMGSVTYRVVALTRTLVLALRPKTSQ
jgi:hypothetical protein